MTKIKELGTIFSTKKEFMAYTECVGGKDVCYYRKIIKYHNKNKDICKLLGMEEFIELLYETLKKWGMNRGHLGNYEPFRDSILKYKKDIIELYQYKLSDVSDDNKKATICEKMENLFKNLKVMKMKTKSKIVGVSKTLHFLLPNLVMPVDRKYVLECLYGSKTISDSLQEQFKMFKEILEHYCKLVEKLNITDKDVDGKNWNMNIPKLIDNVIIGYMSCKDFKEELSKIK